MEWYLYPLVIAGGFAAGFINTLAGSGSLITLPILIFLGLPPHIANGTNRVAITLQNAVAVGRFRQADLLDFRHGLYLAIPAVLGGIVGAQIAVGIDEDFLRKAIGALMVVMLVVMFFRPRRWLEGRQEIRNKRPGLLQFVVFFAIGVHGGFIQAGVGIFLLAGLVLSAGYDLVRGNAVKLLIILCFTVIALAIFAYNDQVDWITGLILAIGNMSGAWVGTLVAVRKGAPLVRWILMAAVLCSGIVLLDLPQIVGRLLTSL
jgi:uncharacterized membrane protein YfcA